jgi:hypothetical protein
VNKRDLLECVKRIHQKMPAFMIPEERLLAENALILRYREWKERVREQERETAMRKMEEVQKLISSNS